MGDLNVPRSEAQALKAIDADVLMDLVDQCIREERSSAIRVLQLDGCGPYVASRFRAFEVRLPRTRRQSRRRSVPRPRTTFAVLGVISRMPYSK